MPCKSEVITPPCRLQSDDLNTHSDKYTHAHHPCISTYMHVPTNWHAHTQVLASARMRTKTKKREKIDAITTNMHPQPQTSICPKPYSRAHHALIHVHNSKVTNSGCPDQVCTTTSEKIDCSNRLQQDGGVMSKLPAMAFRHQGLRITRA